MQRSVDGLQVIEDYLSGLDCAELTIANYKSVLRGFYNWYKVVATDDFAAENITILDLRDYVLYLSNNQTLRSSSIKTKIDVIVNWVYQETGRRLGPVKIPADSERQPAQTFRELRDELIHRAEQGRCLRDVVLVRLLAWTGAKLTQVLSLRVEDLDRSVGIIHCAGRGIPLNTKTYRVVDRYIQEFGLATFGYLFPAPNSGGSRHISDRAARYILSRYGTCSPEDLRRAMQEDLTLQGIAGRVIDAILGRRVRPGPGMPSAADLRRVYHSTTS